MKIKKLTSKEIKEKAWQIVNDALARISIDEANASLRNGQNQSVKYHKWCRKNLEQCRNNSII